MKKKDSDLNLHLYLVSKAYLQNTVWPAADASSHVGISTNTPTARLEAQSSLNGYLLDIQTNTFNSGKIDEIKPSRLLSLYQTLIPSPHTKLKTMTNTLKLTIIVSISTLTSYAQPQLVTTGNNLINTTNPYGADIVIGSDANSGIRHDGSIMWWSTGSASRIGLTGNDFKFSVWNSATPNISLSAEQGGYSYFLGNVGIGTTSPTSRLTIVNEGAEPQGAFLFVDNQNASFGGNSSLAGIRTNGGSGDHYNFLKMQNSDGTKFLVTGSGNVAIGGSQTYGYKLAVHGNIRAQEVRVEAGPWPDFVFEDKYKLPDLKKVEVYIKTNKHLPGLPSANDVKDNGIVLGETNRLLLQKVEELTLYMIQLKKENQAIRARMRDQVKIYSRSNRLTRKQRGH